MYGCCAIARADTVMEPISLRQVVRGGLAVFRHLGVFFRSSAIGSVIGIMPGVIHEKGRVGIVPERNQIRRLAQHQSVCTRVLA